MNSLLLSKPLMSIYLVPNIRKPRMKVNRVSYFSLPETYVFHKLLTQRQTDEKAQKGLREVEFCWSTSSNIRNESLPSKNFITMLTQKQQRRIAGRCKEPGLDVFLMECRRVRDSQINDIFAK